MAFTVENNVLHADGVSLAAIAKQVGTPTYVYSSEVIESQYASLASAMMACLPANRQPLLCFACKANSNLAVLSLLRTLGSGLEIVSVGELKRGLRAGFDPQRIVMTGLGKQRHEIMDCLTAGIKQFNVESLPELAHIAKIADQTGTVADVAIRLNPDVSGGGHHKISTGRKRDKFGIGLDRMYEAFDMARDSAHLNAVGLHIHIGSQVSEVATFKEAFEKLPALVEDLRSRGHQVSRLDIGGGFPIVYQDEKLLDLMSYAQWVRDIIAPLGTEIIMEPGRYLVGSAGVLLSEVLYVKETSDRDFLVVDAAMNDLIRPTLYDAYHRIEPVANRNAIAHKYDVVGPICETADTFSIDRVLPTMSSGDLLVLKEAGAYGMCMASNYNTRELPAEVLVRDGAFHIIRHRQTIDEILDRDIVPAGLA